MEIIRFLIPLIFLICIVYFLFKKIIKIDSNTDVVDGGSQEIINSNTEDVANTTQENKDFSRIQKQNSPFTIANIKDHKKIILESIPEIDNFTEEEKYYLYAGSMSLTLATWHIEDKSILINDPYVIGYAYGYADRINQALRNTMGSSKSKTVVDTMYAGIFNDWNLAFINMLKYTDLQNKIFRDATQVGGKELALKARTNWGKYEENYGDVSVVADKLLNYINEKY